ncbi:MAG: hypothetical protein ACYST6_06640, partial [Planctomycetota bacterium]
ETIRLSLSDPCNATLGSITQHTRTILDDEEGIVWNGLIWYYSHNPDNLFVNAENQLEWNPEQGGQYVTRIPPEPLSSTGDKVEVSYWYMSDGKDDCPPDSCYNCIYCDDDITCIAGTSDFRFGLFQADGEYIQADGFNVYDSVFEDYKGYNWRFGPHLQPYPVRWAQCGTGEIHKTGNFNKKPQWSSNLMTINEGEIRDDEGDIQYIPGFDLPPGEWSMITISLERLSSSDVELSITLNDTTYTCTDTSSSEQPTMIDVFGVHMRNGRPYSILALERVGPAPEPPVYQADDPSPMDGAQDVAGDALLSWTAGEGATQHDVYLGTDFVLVRDADTTSAAYQTTLNGDVNSYDPCGLELGGTYFWRIDESNDVNTYTGSVWHFTVRNYILVDDMESYGDANTIEDTWKSYPYPDINNGAFALLEEGLVHGGDRSMNCYFDGNFGSYCMVIQIFGTAQNWTVLSVNHLSLWFYGPSWNRPGDRLYITLRDNNRHTATVFYGSDPNDIKQEQWVEWNITLEDFAEQGVDLSQVEELIVGVDSEYWGNIYLDDVRLYGTRCIAEHAPTADVTGDCVVDLEDFAVLASQWLGPPATPSADIAPNPPDGWVDGRDLGALAEQWVEMGLFPP